MKSGYIVEPARYQNAMTGVVRISYYNVALSAYYLEQKAKELSRNDSEITNRI
jgi:hypothetical protein